MKTYILKIAIPGPFYSGLDYKAELDLATHHDIKGRRVLVPFRQKLTRIGVVVDVLDNSSVPPHKLKSIQEVIDHAPLLSEEFLCLCKWASEYYHYPLGDVIFTFLPKPVREGKLDISLENKKAKVEKISALQNPLCLNSSQKKVLDILLAQENFQTFLLYGVTGSGKTEVYLQWIAALLAKQKQVLVLIPEIGLTPQTIARFKNRFHVPIVILHSGLSDKERHRAWVAAKNNHAKIILGTRSAVFTPLPNLGAIIIDEEHDSSFKQHDNFRYSARDLAIVRAHFRNVPILLGTATPSLESWQNVKNNKYQLLSLPLRANDANAPSFELIDMRVESAENGLSSTLLSQMEKQLADGNQVLLFLNRRGFAPVLFCAECAWMANCPHCDAKMTVHNKPRGLHCHHCHHKKPIPSHCDSCERQSLITLGYGTENIEAFLQKTFPEYTLFRVDRDTTRTKNSFDELYEKIKEGRGQILLGTQMLAKGHHFPNVTLVGILNADHGLFSIDFRSIERLAQLIYQVAGRAGREEKAGKVFIQTHYPNHPMLQLLIQEGYAAFADSALEEREKAKLPPYRTLSILRADAKVQRDTHLFLQAIQQKAKAIAQTLKARVEISDPLPTLMEKRVGRYHAQLVFQSAERKSLQSFLKVLNQSLLQHKTPSGLHWALDIDPIDVV